MASYALPLNSGSTAHNHGHSHSHSRPALSERPPSWIGQLNGGPLKKTPSTSSLHSHSHSHSHLDHLLSHDMDSQGASDHNHSYSHSNPVDRVLALNPFVKGRPRGESDLGRAPPRISNASKGYAFETIQEKPVPLGTLWPKTEELLTALLIPLPYLLASLAYPTAVTSPGPHLALGYSHDESESAGSTSFGTKTGSQQSPFVLACTLSSTTLILVGVVSKLRSSSEPLDRRKGSIGGSDDSGKKQDQLWSIASLRRLGGRMLSVLLPLYAAMHLGGARVAIVLLTVAATGIGGFDTRPMKHSFMDNWKRTFRTRKATCAVLLLGIFGDFLDASARSTTLVLGHLALAASVLTIPPPFPTAGWSLLTKFKGAPTSSTSGAPSIPRLSLAKPVSPLVSSPEDTHLTLLAGLILSGITMISAITLSAAPPISVPAMTFSTLSVASATALVFFSLPSSLRTQRKPGVALGCILIAVFGYLQSSGIWRGSPYIAVFCTLCYAAGTFDTTASVIPHDAGQHHHDHDHKHQHNHPLHGNHSKMTGFFLKRCTPGSILHSILMERDSRRIAYFAVLNLAFMLVQFFYGFVSGSLGLLTDSIHMLFDCAGLAVGLAAAVMSKWRPSVRFPYGFGKIDTISGFANGIFLMLVSVEIVFDAFERLWEGSELRRLNELLIVSVLGFLVNLIGLTAFGHAHHGHDHGGDSHEGHSHDNENMQGIFLHIMADALGSVAVIISTLLTKYYGWSGWDPIASCIIAVLIFLSAMPLVKSSGLRLLLSLSADVEYGIRNTLQELSSLRGVVGYTVPRFWLEDAGAAHAEAHAHDHKHDHEHDPKHEHSHGDHAHAHGDHCDDGHSHESPHDHSHSHDHSPSHDHSHSHSHAHDHRHDDHAHAHPPAQQKILGVIHIIASRIADVEDVRERTVQFLKGRGMDVVVHVEREGDGRCWCGGGTTPR